MKLHKKLPFKHFILSQIVILFAGLIFVAVLYYILNIQYQPNKKLFDMGPVTTAPKSLRLDLDQPQADSIFYNSSITISGKTNPGNTVLISTDSDDLVIKTKGDGSFTTNWDLDEGVNNFTIVSFDISGESKSEQRTVYYSEEKI